jgi:hypothetical protein
MESMRTLFRYRLTARPGRVACCASAQRRRRLTSELLEARWVLAAIAMTDQEQLLLELVNRARANPAAEAALYGIDLNQDLEPGEITADAKQPLAPHPALIQAARAHASDMLNREFFEHVNPDGKDPSDRARAAGYSAGAGENIAWYGTPELLERDAEVYRRHEALFLSPPHRTNMMNSGYRELGNGIVFGEFERLNAIMVAEEFGNRGGDRFITGVAYSDTVDADSFYTIGESLKSLQITATRVRDGATYTTDTGPSGGYSLQVPTGVYTVTAVGGPLKQSLTVADVAVLNWNTKVDFNSRSMGLGSIAGIVFDDADGDGQRDAAEPALGGRTVYLDSDDDGKRSPDETHLETDSAGNFAFTNLRAATYQVRQELPGGWQQTAPSGGKLTVGLAAAQQRAGLAFGAMLINATPTAADDAFTTDAGRAVSMDVFANDGDVDGQLVLESTQVLRGPENGKVVLNTVTKHLVYTPNPGFVGTDSFDYAVVDNEELESQPARVTIQVNPAVGTAWQNPNRSLDVNNDQFVSSIDALLVLNEINQGGSRRLNFPTAGSSPPPYLDVNGDAFVTALDALLVLNEVNRIAAERRQAAAAEGEPDSDHTAWVSDTSLSYLPADNLVATAVDHLFGSRKLRTPRPDGLAD